MHRTIVCALMWLGIDCVGVLTLGVFESHWILPLLGPLLLLGSVLVNEAAERLWRRSGSRTIALAAIFGVILILQAARPASLAASIAIESAGGRPARGDSAKTIASYLRDRIPAGAFVFILTPESAFEYVLSGASVPTRFGFSYFLDNPYGIRISGSQPQADIAAALACRPRFVVLQSLSTTADLEARFYSIAGAAPSIPLSAKRGDPIAASFEAAIRDARRDIKDSYRFVRSLAGADVYARVTNADSTKATACMLAPAAS